MQTADNISEVKHSNRSLFTKCLLDIFNLIRQLQLITQSQKQI